MTGIETDDLAHPLIPITGAEDLLLFLVVVVVVVDGVETHLDLHIETQDLPLHQEDVREVARGVEVDHLLDEELAVLEGLVLRIDKKQN